jgi:zinc D-Ala-D-Ala carboxypeptidase
MRNTRWHFWILFAALVAVVGVVSFAARSSSGQSRPKTRPTVKPAVRITNSPPSNASSFAPAAAQNLGLRNELTWAFGGKQQRGWYLYDVLIGKTLNTPHDTVRNDFAAALASWQKKRGIGSNGVLDQDVLMAMVSQWQSTRLKDRNPAQPDQLLTAPPADFYDPSRAPELRQVERRTYAAYKEMIAAAVADPTLRLSHTSSGELASSEKYLKIVSAFRTRDYQDNLRRQSPNSGSAGLAVNSPHFTGRALDLYVGGSPVDTSDANRAIQVNTPVYRWLVQNAERFGFRPYFYEPWHWEYVR